MFDSDSVLEKHKMPFNPIIQGSPMGYRELVEYYPEFSKWEIYRELIVEIKYFGPRIDIIYDFVGNKYKVTIVRTHKEGLLLGYKLFDSKDETYWVGEYCEETWAAIMSHIWWYYFKEDITKH